MRLGVIIKARLNLKIDAELKDWAMDYATRRGTSLTDLIVAYLTALKLSEEKKQPGDVVGQI